jgi:hypothetical protein
VYSTGPGPANGKGTTTPGWLERPQGGRTFLSAVGRAIRRLGKRRSLCRLGEPKEGGHSCPPLDAQLAAWESGVPRADLESPRRADIPVRRWTHHSPLGKVAFPRRAGRAQGGRTFLSAVGRATHRLGKRRSPGRLGEPKGGGHSCPPLDAHSPLGKTAFPRRTWRAQGGRTFLSAVGRIIRRLGKRRSPGVLGEPKEGGHSCPPLDPQLAAWQNGVPRADLESPGKEPGTSDLRPSTPVHPGPRHSLMGWPGLPRRFAHVPGRFARLGGHLGEFLFQLAVQPGLLLPHPAKIVDREHEDRDDQDKGKAPVDREPARIPLQPGRGGNRSGKHHRESAQGQEKEPVPPPSGRSRFHGLGIVCMAVHSLPTKHSCPGGAMKFLASGLFIAARPR